MSLTSISQPKLGQIVHVGGVLKTSGPADFKSVFENWPRFVGVIEQNCTTPLLLIMEGYDTFPLLQLQYYISCYQPPYYGRTIYISLPPRTRYISPPIATSSDYRKTSYSKTIEADCCMAILLDDNIWNEFNILTCKLILLGDSL